MSIRYTEPKPRTPGEQLEIMETIAAAFARAEMPIQAIWRRLHEEEPSPEYDELRPAGCYADEGAGPWHAESPVETDRAGGDDPEH